MTSADQQQTGSPEVGAAQPPSKSRWDDTVMALIIVAIAAALLAQPQLVGIFAGPAVSAWATIFVAVTFQALPFLVFGVVLSAVITVYVPPAALRRAMPSRPGLAVPVAGVAGAVLPGCECASVPVAAGLMRRGVPAAAALTFLLAAPAINPVVLVATAVAFPGRPDMVIARLLASLATAVIMGWLWLRFGRMEWLRQARRPQAAPEAGRMEQFRVSVQHDLLHAGGFLILGAMTAATLKVVVPAQALNAVADREWLAIACLAGLAVALAICSEADAFVAAGLSQFSHTSRLVFLVVGPVVDIKLIALQIGTFGRRFTLWFAPLTFLVAIACALGVAAVLL
ncbi:MAG: permease [Sporichthyaceae bacterium]